MKIKGSPTPRELHIDTPMEQLMKHVLYDSKEKIRIISPMEQLMSHVFNRRKETMFILESLGETPSFIADPDEKKIDEKDRAKYLLKFGYWKY